MAIDTYRRVACQKPSVKDDILNLYTSYSKDGSKELVILKRYIQQLQRDSSVGMFRSDSSSGRWSFLTEDDMKEMEIDILHCVEGFQM